MVDGARSREPRLRVVFMGTPTYAVPSLAGLLAAHEVVAVYTQPDRPAGRGRRLASSPVKALADEHGVPVRQPRSLRRDPEAVADLAGFGAEVIVVAAYGLILPRAALAAARSGCVNVHASLLPRWRGAAPVHHAILAGDLETGATLMLMDEGVDTGPILAQRRLAIEPDDTTGTLTGKIADVGARLLMETLSGWAGGTIAPRPQDTTAATVAPRVAAEDGRLPWEAPADALERRVRAMNPWPGAYARLPDGRRIKVHAATVVEPTGAGASPGVVSILDGTIVVATGRGGLRLDEVQLEGRRAMEGVAFVRGHPDLAGARLGGDVVAAP